MTPFKKGTLVTFTHAPGIKGLLTSTSGHVRILEGDSKYKEGYTWKMPPHRIQTLEYSPLNLWRETIEDAEDAILNWSRDEEAPAHIASRLFYLEGSTLTRFLNERDSNRNKVYRAEQALKETKKFSCFDHLKSYFYQLIEAPDFTSRYGDTGLFIRAKRQDARGSSARTVLREVAINRNDMRQTTLLHEIAHCLVSGAHAGHGRLWRAVYIDLLDHFGERGEADRLRDSFRSSGLSWEPYSTIQVPALRGYQIL